MTLVVPFPEALPPGYDWLPDEPVFDPERHLSLEEPAEVLLLTDLGYGSEDLAGKATPVAVSAPFRVLSAEGAEIMLDVARQLRGFAKRAGARIERTVRGGCYRSLWLRQLCISPEVNAHMAAIYGADIAPHPMGLHLGHLNYDPSEVDAAIDKWHHDTLPLDYVMMVTDPATVAGGEFQYFSGTKAEMAEMAAAGQTAPPPDRIVSPPIPGPGYAVALHGNMVVHRAAPMQELGERITMVNGYVATDVSLDAQSRSQDLMVVDDPEVLWAEWAKFAAWRSAGRLNAIVAEIDYISDPETAAEMLDHAIADAQEAAAQMRMGPGEIDHYER